MPQTKFYNLVKKIAVEKMKGFSTIEHQGNNNPSIFDIFWIDRDRKMAIFYTRNSFLENENGKYCECFCFYFVLDSKVIALCLNCATPAVAQRIQPVVTEIKDKITVEYNMKGKQCSFNIYPKIYNTVF